MWLQSISSWRQRGFFSLISDKVCKVGNLVWDERPLVSPLGWLWLPRPPGTTPEQHKRPPRHPELSPAPTPRGKSLSGEKPRTLYTPANPPHSSNIGSSHQQSGRWWRETLYLLLHISGVMCGLWRCFFTVTPSAFPPKIMKPLSTEELPPSCILPEAAKPEPNPAARAP